MARYGNIYCRFGWDYDGSVVDDSDDVLQNYPMEGDEQYVVHRYGRSFSSAYLTLVNGFGAKGGFKRIVELTPKLNSLKFLLVLFELMAAPTNLYHRLFVRSGIKDFVEAVAVYVQTVSVEQLQGLKKEGLDAAFNMLEDLLTRVYTNRQKAAVFTELKVSFAICLLKTDKLERRIQAVRMIGDICRASGFLYEGIVQHGDNSALSRILKVSPFIAEVFGKRSHIQLIQRSTDILRYILPHSEISQSDFNTIWNCCEQDEQSKVEVFKVISATAHALPSQLVGFVVDKFAAVPVAALRSQDVKIICELAKQHNNNLSPEVMRGILEIMWRVVNGEATGVLAETVEKTMKKFCDVITTEKQVPEELMKNYLSRCYVMIKERSNPILALRILMGAMEQLHTFCTFSDREILADAFLNEGNVFNNFFADLEAATAEAKAELINNSFKPQVHKEDTLIRKKFIMFLLKYTRHRLNRSNLEVLWRNWVQSGIAEDQMIFYTLLKEITFHKAADNFSSLNDLKDFFIQSICAEENDFQHLPAEGMEAIKLILITVNKIMGKLVEVEYLKKTSFSFNANFFMGPGFHSFRDKLQGSKDIEFRVLVPPTEITGLSTLWKIILEAKSEFVTIKAIELINKLHIKLSDELKDQIAEISSKFIETAMEKLRLCNERMANSNRSGEMVKVLRLIEEMIEESERKGNDGLTPLLALSKGEPLTVKLKNLYNNSISLNGIVKLIKESLPMISRPEVNVHSRVTFWQLKMVLARQLEVPVETLQISLPGREVTDKDHGKTLEELKFVTNDIVQITKRTEEIVTKASLLDENSRLSKKAKAALVEVFERFGRDGKISRDEYRTFTMICLNSQEISSNDTRIREVFEMFHAEDRGYLTLDEFLIFYEEAAKSRESAVRSNLEAFGYGIDLNRPDEAKSVESVRVVNRYRLPRYLLPNDESYMSLLFSLISRV